MIQQRYLHIIFTVFLGALISACSNNQEALKNAKKTVLNLSETNEKFKASLNKLTANYYKLSEAIAQEDIDDIKKSSYPILTIIKRIDINLLNDQQQLNWNLKSEMIQFSLEEIFKYDDIEEIRLNFNDLSNWIEQAITEFGLTNGVVYIYECEESSSRDGIKWLSSNTDAKNPFGNAYKDCAEITEEITFK